MPETIEVGYETFVSDGDVAFGAVRQVAPHGQLKVIYVENAGFVVPARRGRCSPCAEGHLELRQAGP